MNPIAIAAGLGVAYLVFGGSKSKTPSLPGMPDLPPPPPLPPPEPPRAEPPSLSELDQAHALAIDVERDVKDNGLGYDHERMRAFQRIAFAGKTKEIDGLYGPHTAGALRHFLGHEPPRPLYRDIHGSYAIAPYTPASAGH